MNLLGGESTESTIPWYACKSCGSDLRAYRHEDDCTLSPAAQTAEEDRVQFVIKTHFFAKQLRILRDAKAIDKIYSDGQPD